ncbi:MAG: transglutaminase family protein [Hyphomicrobiaceae bacterium]
MNYEISHTTTYQYAHSVHQSYHLVHLTPRVVAHQVIAEHHITVEPVPGGQWGGVDYFGNPYSILNVEIEHNRLVVSSASKVQVHAKALLALDETTPWRALARRDVPNIEQHKDVWQFTAMSRHGPLVQALAEYAQPSFSNNCPVLVGVADLTRRIYEDFSFDPTATDVSTPVETVLKQRRGVCQDFAHLQIAALRSLGLPAKYVSGYILTHPPEGQQRLVGADASHAWISTWAPECGWVDFDPTNNVIPSDEHITVAYGRDYDDVSPISGVLLGGGHHSVQVAVDVVPVQAAEDGVGL